MLSRHYIGKIPPEDFILEVQKGNVPGHSLLIKFGKNLDIDTITDPEYIWDTGGTYTFPLAADTLDIASTGVDNSAGTGARSITVQGLDADHKEVSIDVTLTGGTVTTTQTFFRVFRAFVKTAGTGEINANDITITHNGAGTPEVARILAEKGQTQMAIYTVPAGKTAYLKYWSGAILKRSTGSAELQFWERSNSGVKRLKSSLGINAGGTTTINKEFGFRPIEEKTDIYIICAEVSDSNSAVFSNFTLLLVDN